MPKTPAVTVVAADDQPLFRAGLAAAIDRDPHLELVGQAGDGRAVLDVLRDARPDVAALGLDLPSMCGLTLLDAVREEGIDTRVVLLSASFGEHDVRRALGLGAAGLVSKLAEPGQVLDAIRAVGQGEQVVDSRLEHLVADGRRFGRDATRPLTAREQQILELMAEGLSGPEMARRLVVSPSTIKSHIENLYEKLGVSQRGAAVAEGMRRGLLA